MRWLNLARAETAPVLYGSLPYIENLSQKIIKLFREHNIKVAQYNLVTNNCFFRNKKDRLSSDLISNVIYQINCNTCHSQYIGQTSQTIKQRIVLHRSDTKLRPDRCALANHVNKTGHHMDFENPRILALENNHNKRLFMEMCFINNSDNSLNNRTDIQNLSKIYTYILKLDKTKCSNLLHSNQD